eukprot:scaffold376_cov156-Amphora_coffeaeformis.AAC.17
MDIVVGGGIFEGQGPQRRSHFAGAYDSLKSRGSKGPVAVAVASRERAMSLERSSWHCCCCKLSGRGQLCCCYKTTTKESSFDCY